MKVTLTRDPQPVRIILACPDCGGPIQLDPEAGFVCLDSCTTYTVTTAKPEALRKRLTATAPR